MEDVEDIIENGPLFLGNLGESLQKHILTNNMGLGDNDVISIREEFECLFQEIQRSTFKFLIYTKQVDDDGVMTIIWDLGEVLLV